MFVACVQAIANDLRPEVKKRIKNNRYYRRVIRSVEGHAKCFLDVRIYRLNKITMAIDYGDFSVLSDPISVVYGSQYIHILAAVWINKGRGQLLANE